MQKFKRWVGLIQMNNDEYTIEKDGIKEAYEYAKTNEVIGLTMSGPALLATFIAVYDVYCWISNKIYNLTVRD